MVTLTRMSFKGGLASISIQVTGSNLYETPETDSDEDQGRRRRN
jgi:hypothetical protein